MKTANVIVLFALHVLEQAGLTSSHYDDTMTFALSLIGCDVTSSSSSPVIAGGDVTRVHVGTMRETPVSVRFSMSANAPVTSSQTMDDVARKRQQSWQVDITVRKDAPQNVTLPTDAVCSPPNNYGINTNGVLITAQGHVDVYVMIGCFASSGQQCIVRHLRPVYSSSSRQYVVPDGSVDGVTFQPRRLVVESVRDNTTVRVVRLGDGLNGAWTDFNTSSSSALLHSVVLDAHQTFTFDVAGAMSLEQLDDGDWSVGDLIGVTASEPVSVVLESIVESTVGVVVQLEPTDGWGSTFAIWRPIVTHHQQSTVHWRSFARITAGRDGATVRVQFWKPRCIVRWLSLPAGYRHFDVDISSSLASGGVIQFHANNPISILQLTVTRSSHADQSGSSISADSTITDCSAKCVRQSVGQFDDVWMTSYCDGNGSSFISIVTVSDELDVTSIVLDGHRVPRDGVEKLERNGSALALLSGNVSDVLLVKVVAGLHYVTLLDRNTTQHVFVGCRHHCSPPQCSNRNKQYDASTVSVTSSAVETVPTGNALSTKTYLIAPRDELGVVVANNSNKMTSTDLSSTIAGVSPMTSDDRPGLDTSESGVQVQQVSSTTSLVATDITIGRNDSGHVIDDVTDINVIPCGVNGSLTTCVVARVSETFNYTDSGSRPSSLELLMPNDVANAGDEHFFHHVARTDVHPSDGLMSSPTVVAVIASLAVAFFFVIACIVGFVIAELVCTKGSLQRIKVSPFVDDYE